MSENIDALIQAKEKELLPLRSRMEELRLQFINETSKFAAEWFVETSKKYVAKQPATTLSLSKEKLAQMKIKVSGLVQNADIIVKKSLSDPKVWWHLTPLKHISNSLYDQLGNDAVGNKFPAIVDKAVRRALGELGTVLENFGYRVTTKGAIDGYYPEYWFEYYDGIDSPPRPFFPHLLEWSEDMQYTIQRYSGQFKKAIVIYNEAEKLNEEKRKRQALDMWDSV